MYKIELDRVTLTYKDIGGDFIALKGVNLSVEEGSFVSVLGSSGSGKSTLISLLDGLSFPTEGAVRIDGEEVTGAGTDRAVVFQHYSLFPWMTVKENLIYGLRQADRKKSYRELAKTAAAFLEKVGLKEFEGKYPAQLSGGMQQRVAIARALAMDTDILLMDEPFGAVDARNRIKLQSLLLSLWENGADESKPRKTVIFVTHDIDEAILLSDRVVVLSSSPGTLLYDVEVPLKRPRERAELIGNPGYNKIRSELTGLFFQDAAGEKGLEAAAGAYAQ